MLEWAGPSFTHSVCHKRRLSRRLLIVKVTNRAFRARAGVGMLLAQY